MSLTSLTYKNFLYRVSNILSTTLFCYIFLSKINKYYLFMFWCRGYLQGIMVNRFFVLEKLSRFKNLRKVEYAYRR
jgi:hypothetical protein